KMQYSKVSRGCEFLVRRLEIGDPVGRVYGCNPRQERSLSINSARRSRIRWHKARAPSPKPWLVTCGLDAARKRKDSSRARATNRRLTARRDGTVNCRDARA